MNDISDDAGAFLGKRDTIAANLCCVAGCPSKVEQWLCGTCFELHCGRHVNGHAIEHAAAKKHSIAIGLADLSAWCYKCESYIAGADSIVATLHEMKFGTVLPSAIQHSEEEQRLIKRNAPKNKKKRAVGDADNDDASCEARVPIDPTECIDSDEKVASDARKLARMLSKARRVVWFTGAGISTNSGIPDFRGPQGLWTMRDQGLEPTIGLKLEAAQPTATHRFIAQRAASNGDFVISQNVDGLHGRSGVSEASLAELHGNAYVERCATCRVAVRRDFDVVGRRGLESALDKAHATGRRCACGGALYDTIVSFGESLPQDALEAAMAKSKTADVYVVLGSSLRVTPAADLPQLALDNGARLVIVNKQPTSLDSKAHLVVHCDIDAFVESTAACLNNK